MRRIAAVGIDNDLAPRQTRVADRTADDESSRRIDQELRVAVQQSRRKVRLDHLFNDGLAQIGNRNIRRMLCGHDDRVNPLNLAMLAVLHGNLALAARAQPRELSVLSRLGQRLRQIVRVGNRRRHQLFCLVAGKAEHHALIARALLICIVIGGVHAHRDILRLLVNCRQYRAAAAVETEFGVVIADLRNRIARNARNVHIAVCRNLAHHQHQTCCRCALARHARLRVLRQNRVQYTV